MLTEELVYDKMTEKELKQIEKLIDNLDTAIRFNVPLFGESLISIRDVLTKIINDSEVNDGTTK